MMAAMLAMLLRDMDRWQIPSSCAPIAAELRDLRRDDGRGEVAEPGDAAGEERKSEGVVEAGAGGGDPSMKKVEELLVHFKID